MEKVQKRILVMFQVLHCQEILWYKESNSFPFVNRVSAPQYLFLVEPDLQTFRYRFDNLSLQYGNRNFRSIITDY